MASYRRRSVRANGIELSVLEFEAPAEPREGGPIVVLLHGFMDAAESWAETAPHLINAGYTVFAPDLRGFGDSGRVPSGGYYHFADYVADVADWLDQLTPNAPVLLVGHSMGGTVSTLYAGSSPERVKKLAVLEGLGPPEFGPEAAPLRMKKWLSDLAAHRARGADKTMTREVALARLRGNHPRVPAPVLERKLDALVRERDGGLAWAFDPLHRTTSPMPFSTPMYKAFASAVACPVLYVTGGALGYRPPDEEDRLVAFRSLERFDLPHAGHMVHWVEPEKLSDRLVAFFEA